LSIRKPHIISDVKEWPIYKISQNRHQFVQDINALVYKQLKKTHSKDFEALLEKTAYLEKIRVRTNPWKVDPPDEAKYWISISQEIKKSSLAEDKEYFNEALLKRIINRYSEEIVSSFKVKTYHFAIVFLTKLLRRILNTFTGRGNRFYWGSKRDLYNRLHITGKVDEARELFKKGTVVVVPTHFSNMDSIMMGYILDRMVGFPSFAYAAGLNLFDYEIAAYFMNRLGTYRVDRRKKNPVYLECLKAVTSLSLQNGVNNIFFPGGTRSRSGSIEKKLKLGLLGSVVQAQRANFENGKDEKIYIVPVIAAYPFVLEAKSLINNYLRSTGKEKYIHSRDDLSMYKKTYRFIKNLFGRGSEIYLTLGEPMDVMGNYVNQDGESIDERGSLIKLKDYFLSAEGEVEENPQRESVYTRILGDKVIENYYRHNTVLSSHLIAFLAFQYFVKRNSDLSLYNLLNLKVDTVLISKEDFHNIVAQAQVYLSKLEEKGEIALSDDIKLSVDELIKSGVSKVGVFHPQKTLYTDKHGNIRTEDLKLLYYYHNRMEGYDIETKLDWSFLNAVETEV